MTYGRPQWPRARKGEQLTHVTFRPDGSVRSATFEKVAKARPAPAEAPRSRRGLASQGGLFD